MITHWKLVFADLAEAETAIQALCPDVFGVNTDIKRRAALALQSLQRLDHQHRSHFVLLVVGQDIQFAHLTGRRLQFVHWQLAGSGYEIVFMGICRLT